MAKVVGVSLPFLSAVENGKKNVPADWFDKLSEHYNLTNNEQLELKEAIEESKTHLKIITNGAGNNQRKAALQFARSFDDMDDETALKILELLRNKGEQFK